MRSFVALIACALTFGLSAGEAEAKRFGGSKSFGMQRSAPATAPKAAPTAPKAAAAPCGAADGCPYLSGSLFLTYVMIVDKGPVYT